MDKDKLIDDFEEELPDGKEIIDSDNLIYIIYPDYSFEVDIETGDVTTPNIEVVEDDTPWELAGSGTEEDPYLIESIEDLVAFSNSVNSGTSYSNKYVKLTTDLDFDLPFSYDNPKTKVSEKTNRIIEEDSSGTELKTFLTSGIGFNPIGNETKSFNGNFNGNGKVIKNIYIDRADEDYVALFGKNGGKIRKIGITGKIIGNGNYFASIVGSNVNNIELSFSEVELNIINNSTSCYAGGIVGQNNSGTINNCYFNGKIFSNINSIKSLHKVIGGIVGTNESNSNTQNCYNLSDIISNDQGSSINYGGIAGINYGVLNNNYNFGNINTIGKNSYSIGGISGLEMGNGVNNCYNKGIMDTETSWTGGISGYVQGSDVIISNSYYQRDTAKNGIGYIYENSSNKENLNVGVLEESEMPSVMEVISTGNEQVEYNGEMVDIWKEDVNNINNGYPILFWQ